MRDIRAVAVLSLLLASGTAAPDSASRERTGYAYELGGDSLLYSEEHKEYLENGRTMRSEVRYRDPDGTVIATKRLDFTIDSTSPDFRLENTSSGHLEGAERNDNRLRVYFRKTGSHGLKEQELQSPGDAIIDGGFDRFIESNWSKLIEGETFRRPFLVPSLQRFLDFRISLERRTDTDVVFIMEPASFLLRIVGDGIAVTYDRDSAALKRYEGISNIRDKNGENYAVRVEFPAAGRRPADHDLAETQ